MEYLNRLKESIDETSLRERLLIFVTTLFLTYLLWSMLLLSPLDQQRHKINNEIKQTIQENSAYGTEITSILNRTSSDPNAEDQGRLDDYRKKIDRITAKIRSSVSGLTPNEMSRALEEILERSDGLKLSALQNLKTSKVIKPVAASEQDNKQGADTTQPPLPQGEEMTVYRHGIRLKFEGSYDATLNYLDELATLEWAIYWDSIDIVMDEYPRAQIVIEVFTLSFNEGWLNV